MITIEISPVAFSKYGNVPTPIRRIRNGIFQKKTKIMKRSTLIILGIVVLITATSIFSIFVYNPSNQKNCHDKTEIATAKFGKGCVFKTVFNETDIDSNFIYKTIPTLSPSPSHQLENPY